MTPEYENNRSGSPSIVAFQPGTSVSRILSTCGEDVVASIRIVEGAGRDTESGVPSAWDEGRRPEGPKGVNVAMLVPDT